MGQHGPRKPPEAEKARTGAIERGYGPGQPDALIDDEGNVHQGAGRHCRHQGHAARGSGRQRLGACIQRRHKAALG